MLASRGLSLLLRYVHLASYVKGDKKLQRRTDVAADGCANFKLWPSPNPMSPASLGYTHVLMSPAQTPNGTFSGLGTFSTCFNTFDSFKRDTQIWKETELRILGLTPQVLFLRCLKRSRHFLDSLKLFLQSFQILELTPPGFSFKFLIIY